MIRRGKHTLLKWQRYNKMSTVVEKVLDLMGKRDLVCSLFSAKSVGW